MANISVAELLFDPDFVDPVTVTRLIETTGADGIATRAPVDYPILASIQASSGDNQTLGPDGAMASSTYEVITTFPLAVASDSTAADTVTWRGMTFTVTSIARFGNFAGTAGHYEGVMEMKPVTTTVGPP